MLKETVFVFAALVVFADATVVNHCNSNIPFKNTKRISISGCNKPTCLLKRGTIVTIKIKLVPDKDIQSLTHDVSRIISNVSEPEVVDGTDACDTIYNVDGSENGCPLKKGVKYVYKKSYYVSPLFPTISMVIHYALREGNDRVICFKVPLKFTK